VREREREREGAYYGAEDKPMISAHTVPLKLQSGTWLDASKSDDSTAAKTDNRWCVHCASPLLSSVSPLSPALVFFLLPGPSSSSFVVRLRCHFEGLKKKRFEVPIRGPHLTKRPLLSWGFFFFYTIFFFHQNQNQK
jgi:hypothetical protein